jgi:hypothetical protein
MSEPQFFNDAVDRILAYLEGGFGQTFHRYFEGDPIYIPLSLMPAICVIKLSGETKPSATGTNDLMEKILIKVVYSKKDDYGSNFEDDTVDFTERKLRRLISARDPVTKQFLPGTIFGILMTNFTLGDQVLDMTLSDDYAIDYRPTTASPKEEYMLTQEAYITVDLRMRVVVLPRV